MSNLIKFPSVEERINIRYRKHYGKINNKARVAELIKPRIPTQNFDYVFKYKRPDQDKA